MLMAAVFLGVCLAMLPRYHTRTFETARDRAWFLAVAWLVISLGLAICWFVPYLGPESHGRVYFLVQAATSGTLGVVTVMNLLVVGMPLFLLLGLGAFHLCTTTRSSHRDTGGCREPLDKPGGD